MNLLRASVFKYERHDILQDSFGHPSKKLLSLEFAQSFCSEFRASRHTTGPIGHPGKRLLSFEFATSIRFQLRASRYITRLNRTSEKKVIVARICSELTFSHTSISIRYGIHSDIREKSSCRGIVLRASVLN